MFTSSLFWVVTIAVSCVIALMFGMRASSAFRERSMLKARELFGLRREWLEAEFLKLAGMRGLPRDLRWVDAEFDNPVQFARDRSSGQLRALVATTIRFEAVEGSDMEDVEAVNNLRAATSVFTYDGRKWTTTGRALFNLNPAEAIQHYRHELELVD